MGKINNMFSKADVAIDEFFNGPKERRAAKVAVGWFIFHGLKAEEVPQRFKDQMSEEDFNKIVQARS